jgi:hypothetical protein
MLFRNTKRQILSNNLNEKKKQISSVQDDTYTLVSFRVYFTNKNLDHFEVRLQITLVVYNMA